MFLLLHDGDGVQKETGFGHKLKSFCNGFVVPFFLKMIVRFAQDFFNAQKRD